MGREGTVTFWCSAENLVMDPFAGNAYCYPRVKSFTAKKGCADSLEIQITVSNVFAQETAVTAAEPVARYIADLVALESDCPVGDPTLSGMCIPDSADVNLRLVMTSMTVVYDVADPNPLLDERAVSRITSRMKSSANSCSPATPALMLYRLAIHQKDAIARFMLLYNIMLMRNGDSQGNVDQEIERFDPSVAKTPSPMKSSKNETIYTRLRNEVGHHRAGTDPHNTSLEIGKNVRKFQKVVRQAIASP